MPKTLDARGLPCPQPVIMTRNAMREADRLTVLISEQDQVANVSRLAEKAGWQVAVDHRPDGYAVQLAKSGSVSTAEPAPDTPASAPTPGAVLVVSDATMGRGDAELGAVLMQGFFHALMEVEQLPDTIVLYNAGVKLAVEGSPVLDDLQALETRGVEILVCGTCLSYYELRESALAGTVSNMYTIVESLLGAGKIINL